MLGRPLLVWDVSVRCDGGGKRAKRSELPAGPYSGRLDSHDGIRLKGPVASYLWNMAHQHRLS